MHSPLVGEPTSVGSRLRERWGDVATRISLYATYDADPAVWPVVVEAVRSGAGG